MNLADISKLGVANPFKQRYDNYIGGEFIAPLKGDYFPNLTPITGQPFCEVARSGPEDIEMALDAAHAAKQAWGKTSRSEKEKEKKKEKRVGCVVVGDWPCLCL